MENSPEKFERNNNDKKDIIINNDLIFFQSLQRDEGQTTCADLQQQTVLPARASRYTIQGG